MKKILFVLSLIMLVATISPAAIVGGSDVEMTSEISTSTQKINRKEIRTKVKEVRKELKVLKKQKSKKAMGQYLKIGIILAVIGLVVAILLHGALGSLLIVAGLVIIILDIAEVI